MFEFGATYEAEVLAAIRKAVSEAYKSRREPTFFTSDFIGHVRDIVQTMSESSREQLDLETKMQNPPPQSSQFRCEVADTANFLIVAVNFFHEHRNHPFSVDGAAAYTSRRLLDIQIEDLLQ